MIIVLILIFSITRVLFLSNVFPFVVLVLGRSQVINLRGAIVIVVGGNILDGL